MPNEEKVRERQTFLAHLKSGVYHTPKISFYSENKVCEKITQCRRKL